MNGSASFQAATGGRKMRKPKDKMEKTMHEFKMGSLHSGSKKGPKVKSRKQAIAIGLNQARKSGEKSDEKMLRSKRMPT
jgi:hypothetical protein